MLISSLCRSEHSAQNEQRQRRKDEQAASKPWKLQYFDKLENDPECAFPELLGFTS